MNKKEKIIIAFAIIAIIAIISLVSIWVMSRRTRGQCSSCGKGEFIQERCTADTDTVCKECTTCGKGEFIQERCTADTDTVCKECTTAKVGEYISTPCTMNKDGVASRCGPARDCDVPSCTGPTSSVCAKCSPGFILSGTDCKATDFTHNLIEKATAALNEKAPAMASEVPGLTVTLGFFMQNSGQHGGNPVKFWVSYYNGTDPDGADQRPPSDAHIGTIVEPSYMFGSFTKPITSALVTSKLYNLFKEKDINEDFFEWLTGISPGEQYPSKKGVTFKDLYNLTQGFKNSNYTETLIGAPNNKIEKDTWGSVGYMVQNKLWPECTARLQDWLYNCPLQQGALSHDINRCSGIYCEGSKNGASADAHGGTAAESNTDSSLFMSYFLQLTPYELMMMRGGIPDADTLGVDNTYQERYRTHPFGPIQFLYEYNGFQWKPGAECQRDSQGQCITGCGAPWTSQPGYLASYSSSGYTLLGTLLYLLDDTQGVAKEWQQLDVNAMLPTKLRDKINFAGTSGNNAARTESKNQHGEIYQSFNAITRCNPGDLCILKSPKGENSIYPGGAEPDWDISSGLFDGNSWGKPSDASEVLFNIMSTEAENPIISSDPYSGDKSLPASTYSDWTRQEQWWSSSSTSTIAKYYAARHLRHDITSGLWDNIITGDTTTCPWMQGMSYNCGTMGTTGNKVTTSTGDNYLWGHAGATYGNRTFALFVPRGTCSQIHGDMVVTACYNTDDDEKLNQGMLADIILDFIKSIDPPSSK